MKTLILYAYLEDCDNLIIASPIWFSELRGPLLSVASRFQTYFAGRFFRAEAEPIKHRLTFSLARSKLRLSKRIIYQREEW